ncbi:MAG: glycine cleavage system protein GcvH [Pseudomonadota bacterium]
MEIPEDLRYTKDHEWARLDKAKKIVTVGVTDYAQEKMGDVVYVELPDEGDQVIQSEPFGSVESVKAVSDLFSPVSGVVAEVNDTLVDTPEAVNDEPYNEAWMIKIKIQEIADVEDLMTAEEYKQYLSAQEEA